MAEATSGAFPATPVSALAWRRPLALVLMAASGFAGLGYQVVWTQQSALWLGHESMAVLAVVAAFFGGLAVGALTLGPLIERSAHPVRWYAGCEAVIGAWGLVLVAVMAPASGALLALTGVQPVAAWQWTIAFGGMFVLLLPATAAMGATLPAIERAVSGPHRQARSIAAYYASNTFGAVLGVLTTAFWLIPSIGLSRTAMLCVALNVLCAVAAPALASMQSPVAMAFDGMPSPARRLRVTLFCTGLLGIGYEVLVVRVLSQVCEDTVYTFAMLLAVYLVGTAAGAAAYRRWGAHEADGGGTADRLLVALAGACLVGIASLWFAEDLQGTLRAAWDGGVPSALFAEAALALAAFGLPTVAMGALFSRLADQASVAGLSFGRAIGLNIVGAATAPVLFGVLIAPGLGPKGALLGVVAGYLLLVTGRAMRRPVVVGVAVVTLATAIATPPLAFVDVPDGGHIVSYREGVMAAVSVVEDADGVSRLRIDNRQQEGSSSSLLVDARQALLPLLLHPAPHRALFLGLGTGMTAASAAEDPTLDVDAVELLPEVIAASRHFTAAFQEGVANPRLHLIDADARRYVKTSPRRYDVVVADNFHPARGGSGALYTVEHFVAIRQRLAAGGLFCQWLPLHQLDLETLRSIVRSFMLAYPNGRAMLASNSLATPVIGLVGDRDDRQFDFAGIDDRLQAARFPRPPAAFGLEDPFALLGSFIAGPKALIDFADGAAANTDDLPVVAYRAPRVTYAPLSLPQDRLMTLLDTLVIEPDELLADATSTALARRLADYWRARRAFIAAGRNVRPDRDVRAMLAQVREPLLKVLAISPDFRPAYDPLLRMALALPRSESVAAQSLLRALQKANPERPEAAAALASP